MSGSIDEQAVRHISHLARLKPTEAEVHMFSEQLSAILAYMDQLNEVDTTDVPPTAHALGVHNVFRNDKPVKSFTSEQALSNAPQRAGNFFTVPKIFDQDTGA